MIWTNRFLTSSAAVRVKVFVLQWGTWRQPQFYHPLHPHFSNPQVRNLAIQSDLDNIFKMWREKNQTVLLDRYRVKMPRFATCDNDLIDKKFWPWCWPLRICNFVWRFPLCERQDGGEWSLQQSVGPSPPDHHSISQTLMHLPGSQRAVLNAALECRPVLYSVSKIYSDLQLYKFFSSSCFQKYLIRWRRHH